MMVNLLKFYSSFSKRELEAELLKLKAGCSGKVDSYGDCWHIHTNKVKYCNKCKRRINIVEDLLVQKGVNKIIDLG